jgi:HEAT repeat protein
MVTSDSPSSTEAQVESWLDLIDVPDARQMDDAALSKLWGLTPADSSAIRPLVRRLESPHSNIRGFAARFLGLLGESAKPAVPALYRQLQNKDSGLEQVCLMALQGTGFSVGEVSEAVEARLVNPGSMIRIAAAGALLRWVDTDQRHLDILEEIRHSHDPAAKCWAVNYLGDLLPRIPDALPVIMRFLNDYLDSVVEDVAFHLAKHNTSIVVPALLETLGTADKRLRWGALMALRTLGEQARPFEKDVIDRFLDLSLFEDSSIDVRRLVANTCEATPLSDPVVVQKLRGLLQDKEPWVQEQAATALLAIPQVPAVIRSEAQVTLDDLNSK